MHCDDFGSDCKRLRERLRQEVRPKQERLGNYVSQDRTEFRVSELSTDDPGQQHYGQKKRWLFIILRAFWVIDAAFRMHRSLPSRPVVPLAATTGLLLPACRRCDSGEPEACSTWGRSDHLAVID